jgi:catechol 2,3-dioxygenase-like lactoylglutathione lyase family enzyme
MLQDSHAFSGFSVKAVDETVSFYKDTLGLDVEVTDMGLQLHLVGGTTVFMYVRANHVPAEYTILNFPVDDIDAAVDELTSKGVVFEQYDDLPVPQSEKQILYGKKTGYGPDIAWFKDPSGNTLSVLSM